MLGSELNLDLSIPEQTLVSLSFADANPTGFKVWVDNLPLANVGEISRQLYQAIIEFNQLSIAPHIRLQLLEIMRSPIEYACKELSKHFLNLAVVLPAKQQKIANLAQTIQLHLATGYKIVLMEGSETLSNEKQKKVFTQAAHRLFSEYGQIILRSCQLYTATPKNIWLEMHRTFSFAESLNLLDYTIEDNQNKYQSETSLEQAYKRNLLLASARPNQLRQNDIQIAFDLFELWSDYVTISEDNADSAVFIVNMHQDNTPRYKTLISSNSAHHYGFDTTDLVERIHEYLNAIYAQSQHDAINKNTLSDEILPVPKNVNEILLNHLNQAFGVLTKRSFKRIANEGALNLCIGLSASHYFSSGKVAFHTQMLQNNSGSAESDDNIFLTQALRRQDAWSDGYDTGGRVGTPHSDAPISFNHPGADDSNDAYPQYEVPLVNTSPGGYCLEWDGEIPSNIQAGEILSIRESIKQPWRIAVIRWIRHIKQAGTQVGIELLAPSAKPCGVQLLQKTGDPSEYMRGLLLPEISAIGQSATLITPRVPFRSGQKVSIKFSNTEGKCQLEKKVSATGSFSQFELSEQANFKAAEQKVTHNTRSHDTDDDFDSLWPTL
ncbi:MAG: GTPase [Oleiphilus sp.]